MIDKLNKITFSDAYAFLMGVPPEFVSATVTSPPCWRHQRRIPDDHRLASMEMGQEETPNEYIAGMADVFTQVYRATRTGGSLWLHIADTRITPDLVPDGKKTISGFHPGELVDIPGMLASRLRSIGWRFVSEVVWSKTNANHMAAKLRPSDSHEKILVFSKGPRMYFDHLAAEERSASRNPDETRKCRTVWTSPSESVHGHVLRSDVRDSGRYLEADPGCPIHARDVDSDGCGPLFAPVNASSLAACACRVLPKETTYVLPLPLVTRCVESATSRVGHCAECGKPFERIIESGIVADTGNRRTRFERSTGWKPTCKCEQVAIPTKSVVCDPFAGSGTTLIAAKSKGRDFIGCELSPEYVASIAPARLIASIL